MAASNIFQAYLQPPKSVSDYMSEMDSADIRREQLKAAQQRNALEAMTMQDTLDQRRTAAEDRNALQRIAMGWNADTTPEQRIAALRNSGRAGLMSQADALEKGALERQKTQAAAGKDQAETVGKYLDAMKTLAGGVLANPTPQAAMFAVDAWERLTGQKATEDRAQLAQMTMPEQIKAWAQSRSLTADQYMTQLLKQREADQNARNDLVGPDGKPNMPVIEAKKAIQKAGATNVKIENKLGEGLAKEVGPMVASSYNAAMGAQQQVENSDNLIRAVDSNKVIAGPGASLRLKGAQVADALGIGGKDNAEKIQNTRAAIQGLAQATVAARAALKGQGQVSDYEGRLLQRAQSGEIDDLTPGEIRQIAVANKRLSQQLMQQHSQIVGKLRMRDSTAGLADMFEIPENSTQAATPSAPGGWSYVGPVGGK